MSVSLALALTVVFLTNTAATLAFFRAYRAEQARAERYMAALVHQQGDPVPAKILRAADVKKVQEKLQPSQRPRQIGMQIR